MLMKSLPAIIISLPADRYPSNIDLCGPITSRPRSVQRIRVGRCFYVIYFLFFSSTASIRRKPELPSGGVSYIKYRYELIINIVVTPGAWRVARGIFHFHRSRFSVRQTLAMPPLKMFRFFHFFFFSTRFSPPAADQRVTSTLDGGSDLFGRTSLTDTIRYTIYCVGRSGHSSSEIFRKLLNTVVYRFTKI